MRVSAAVRTLLLSSILCGCAGKLDQPKRFAAIVQKYSGAGTGGVATRPGPGSVDDDGGMTSTPDAGSAPPPACALSIFKNTCGLTGCHAKGSATIDLASAGVASRIVNQKSISMMCKGRVYVSSTGQSSLLLDKLGASPPCGQRMPIGGMLSAADTKCLTDWVKSLGAGAPDAGSK